MWVTRLLAAIGLSVAVGAPAAAQHALTDCAAMDFILKQARTDFSSLREKRMAPGNCYFKPSEFGCAWAFTGDAYGMSDAQVDRLKKCIAQYPTAQPTKGRRGAAAFSVDPDLTVAVASPEMDVNGNWVVRLKIQSSYKLQ